MNQYPMVGGGGGHFMAFGDKVGVTNNTLTKSNDY